MSARFNKISFCIICMNRLHQLKDTLIKNINDNEDYKELEFVLLNYNSQDGMEQWVHQNLRKYISEGRLKYYHTLEPKTFSHSHSKNLAFKLATGDIVCNINADHFTGPGFAEYVNSEFNIRNNIVLTTVDYFNIKKQYRPAKDLFGKVCVRKKDFIQVEGFDERMNGYGFEDWDFINRLEIFGLKRIFIEDPNFLKFISHSEEERFSNEKKENKLLGIFVRYITNGISEIFFLYNDNCLEKGTFICKSHLNASNYQSSYQEPNFKFEFDLQEKHLLIGHWKEKHERMQVIFEKEEITLTKLNNMTVLLNEELNLTYYLIYNKEIIENLLAFKHTYFNRTLMEANLENKRIKVNNTIFGERLI